MFVASLLMSAAHSLVSLGLPLAKDAETVKVVPATNHIIAIDCSGSMYAELPKIRTQLNNKLATLVRENDTVSIIWFSGRGEAGFIVKGQEIKSVQGLAALQKAVDRYLTTVGLTGFKDPLMKVQEAVEEVTKSSKITTHSLLFLTDGYDNQWSQAELMKALKPLSTSLASAVFVEYGYYANRALLTKMAEEVGGRTIFSESFRDFEPSFEQVISNKLSGKPKKKITLPSVAKYDVAFSYDAENGITAYGVEDGVILVDEEVTKVFYHSAVPVDNTVEEIDQIDIAGFALQDIYASLIVLSQRMKSQDVYDTLGFLGDVDLVDSFVNAFGKQNLYAFQGKTLEIVQGQRQPYATGRKANYLPKNDAYCLLNLFEDLMQSPENRFLSEHPEFINNYQRIGAKKVAAVSKREAILQDELGQVTQEYTILAEQAKKDSSKRQLLGEVTKKMKEITDQIEEEFSATDVKFTLTPNPNGTAITDLVWNQSRPNLSVLVRQTGVVTLPENSFGLTEIESFRYRNYTLIRDGIVNVKVLPVYLAAETYNKLKEIPGLLTVDSETVENAGAERICFLNLTTLPIVNRKMVADVSAKELAELQYELTQTQGAQSVFNFFQKEHFPKESKGFSEDLGIEAAEWLKELGITDYNGFAPRVTSEKMGEVYMSTELNVKIEGLASKPTAKAVWDKIKAGKALTERERLFEAAMLEYKAFVESDIYTKNEDQDELLKTWLLNKQKAIVKRVREYLNKMARIKFSLILGQTWFKEFKDIEDNELVLTVDNKPVKFTFLLEDKEVEI